MVQSSPVSSYIPKIIRQIIQYYEIRTNCIILTSSFRIVAKLEENAPDQVDVFKTNCNTVMKDILGRFKDLQFFTGESMDCDGMIAMMEYRDIDGVSTPILMCFKHGLEAEKF